MSFWNSFEKRTKKIKGINLKLSIIGGLLAIFSLGSILKLEKYSYIILIAAALIVAKYQYDNCIGWYKKKSLSYARHWFGFLGTSLVVFSLGALTDFWPLKTIALIVGIALVVPAAVDFFK